MPPSPSALLRAGSAEQHNHTTTHNHIKPSPSVHSHCHNTYRYASSLFVLRPRAHFAVGPYFAIFAKFRPFFEDFFREI